MYVAADRARAIVLYVCMYTMYVHPYVHTSKYKYLYIYIYIYMCVYVYVYIHIYIYIRTNMYMYVKYPDVAASDGAPGRRRG